MSNQHPGFPSFVGHPTAMPRSAHAQSHHQMRVQLGVGVGQAFTYQGTSGGSSGAQMPSNLHHIPHTINTMPVLHPHPHSGDPRLFPPGYNVRWCCVISAYKIRALRHRIKTPTPHKPEIPRQPLAYFHATQNSQEVITGWHHQTTQSLGACALQPGLQMAIPPQQPPPKVGTPVKYT